MWWRAYVLIQSTTSLWLPSPARVLEPSPMKYPKGHPKPVCSPFSFLRMRMKGWGGLILYFVWEMPRHNAYFELSMGSGYNSTLFERATVTFTPVSQTRDIVYRLYKCQEWMITVCSCLQQICVKDWMLVWSLIFDRFGFLAMALFPLCCLFMYLNLSKTASPLSQKRVLLHTGGKGDVVFLRIFPNDLPKLDDFEYFFCAFDKLFLREDK